MMLVEVGPILHAVASEHRVRISSMRAPDRPRYIEARNDAVRRLREAGLTLRVISDLLNVAHSTVRTVTDDITGLGGKGRIGSTPAKFCPRCDVTKPLDDFGPDRKTADRCRSHCNACQRQVDRKYRERQVRYRRQGCGNQPMSLRVPVALHEVLADTAERHGVTMAYIVERAITKAMACKDCGKRLRIEGSDCCAACDAMWTPEVVAS